MLSEWLVTELFALFLVFCRLGSAVMLLPGFGELYVPVRIRLLFALSFSFLVAPVIGNLPALPESVPALFVLVVAETLIGTFIGGLTRILISAVSMAGTIISLQANLASLMTVDVTQIQGQAQVLSNFLSISALILLFSTNMHHVMLEAIVDSYSLFLPGVFPDLGEFSHHATKLLNSAFNMAMQMSAPFIVIGTILYLAMGIIARLIPNIQVFFVMTAPQILLNFFLLMVLMSGMMLWYLDYFKSSLTAFLAP